MLSQRIKPGERRWLVVRICGWDPYKNIPSADTGNFVSQLEEDVNRHKPDSLGIKYIFEPKTASVETFVKRPHEDEVRFRTIIGTLLNCEVGQYEGAALFLNRDDFENRGMLEEFVSIVKFEYFGSVQMEHLDTKTRRGAEKLQEGDFNGARVLPPYKIICCYGGLPNGDVRYAKPTENFCKKASTCSSCDEKTIETCNHTCYWRFVSYMSGAMRRPYLGYTPFIKDKKTRQSILGALPEKYIY